MDFLQFCRDYNLPIAPHGHKHHRVGWINVPCPFCTGNPGYHIGYQIQGPGTGMVCFRCHGHGLTQTIARLARLAPRKAAELIEQYGGKPYSATVKPRREWQLSKDIKLPMGTTELTQIAAAIDYLDRRNFDPFRLEKEFDLMATGPVGKHRLRIVIPVQFKGFNVSYTCRSYAGSETRYIACDAEDELVPAKDILYNIDNVTSRRSVVVVEGCTDTWRLGAGCVATFGTKITFSQLKFLVQFKRVVLIRDMDDAGLNAWEDAYSRLCAFGVDAVIQDLDVPDAAEMDEREAKYLMKQLL